jgi:hypothetical protein
MGGKPNTLPHIGLTPTSYALARAMSSVVVASDTGLASGARTKDVAVYRSATRPASRSEQMKQTCTVCNRRDG